MVPVIEISSRDEHTGVDQQHGRVSAIGGVDAEPALFEELDAAHRENAELRARCQRMEAQLAADNRRKVEEDSFVPELEPLEMPTFDFDQGM